MKSKKTALIIALAILTIAIILSMLSNKTESIQKIVELAYPHENATVSTSEGIYFGDKLTKPSSQVFNSGIFNGSSFSSYPDTYCLDADVLLPGWRGDSRSYENDLPNTYNTRTGVRSDVLGERYNPRPTFAWNEWSKYSASNVAVSLEEAYIFANARTLQGGVTSNYQDIIWNYERRKLAQKIEKTPNTDWNGAKIHTYNYYYRGTNADGSYGSIIQNGGTSNNLVDEAATFAYVVNHPINLVLTKYNETSCTYSYTSNEYYIGPFSMKYLRYYINTTGYSSLANQIEGSKNIVNFAGIQNAYLVLKRANGSIMNYTLTANNFVYPNARSNAAQTDANKGYMYPQSDEVFFIKIPRTDMSNNNIVSMNNLHISYKHVSRADAQKNVLTGTWRSATYTLTNNGGEECKIHSEVKDHGGSWGGCDSLEIMRSGC